MEKIFKNVKSIRCNCFSITIFFLLQNVVFSSESIPTLQEYLKKIGNAARPQKAVVVDAVNYIASENASLKKAEEFKGRKNVLLWEKDGGWVEWKVHISEAGLYNMALDYYPLPGKGLGIELAVMIDGKIPYKEARKVTFNRVWKDTTGIRKDKKDNDLRPKCEEEPMWQQADFIDTEGFYNRSLPFYFTEGEHTIRIVSIREPFALRQLIIYNPERLPSYDEYIKNNSMNDKIAKNIIIKVQGEKPYLKSDPILYPTYDRTDPATEPYHVSKIRLNTIGQWNWRYPGMWISWKVEVPEDGYYKIAIKVRQNFVRGLSVHRKLYIDGKIPFKEAEDIEFPYSIRWYIKTIGEKNKPYLVYLTKGVHEIKLEATLGSFTELLSRVETTAIGLNDIYRKIIMITGASPDLYRDYFLEEQIPGLVKTLLKYAGELEEEAALFEKLAGQKGGEAEFLRRVALQLRSMAEDTDTIPARISNFRDNLSGLSSWLAYRRDQPLEIDYILVASPDAKLPSPTASIASKFVNSLKSFIYSFIEDYNNIGEVYEGQKVIKLWVGGGRDQAQIIRDLINDSFTPQTGIKVNVSLVQAGLIEAILAGKGPDVVLTVSRGQPVNLAARGALVDLSKFKDFDEVKKRFAPTALVPYTYNGGVYGLPVTQDFYMMFYRKDILKELNIDVPQTWDDMYRVIAKLQRYNLQVGLPYQRIDALEAIDAGLGARNLFPTLLLQFGGSFYDKTKTRTLLDRPEAVAAFKTWTDFYTKYNLPLIYDFYNRFRTGEMPIGIAPYTTYNLLATAAPEIRNEWAMAPIPGVKKANGEIDRSTGASGTACIILKKSKNKEACWEFLKWWTSDETQMQFGKELEMLMGTAARYNTANLKAFQRLPWNKEELESLEAQWKYVEEIEEVPGSYYITRSIDSAFSAVVYQGINPRESLWKYTKEINDELERKRIELSTYNK
uniref:Extracellular solute-binding protein n=1 Tax=Caldicellulosiruptor owensensis TaxID=55205 RepID=A0A7C5V0J3_9FIRM